MASQSMQGMNMEETSIPVEMIGQNAHHDTFNVGKHPAIGELMDVSVPVTGAKVTPAANGDDKRELNEQSEMIQSDAAIGLPPDKAATGNLERTADRISRQFWQAGDLFPDNEILAKSSQVGLDHARLHPRFLHSNATSHKWALGAFVELLDNSMDEVQTGCTYVKVDKLDHPTQGTKNPMLLVEDNGGGMEPAVIRHCMSFGFSRKKGKQMIGQYGNGFKTSTMRLGADAMVLTKNKKSSTCSVGLLSFTFLSATKSQDVLVPIIDYSLDQRTRIVADEDDWQRKLSLICSWGPFESEADLWKQFDSMPSQGTRVLIWNLWQTSEGTPELDFNVDDEDIKLQGGEEEVPDITRKRKSDEGMKRCQAYRHSLRQYVAILYLKWPEGFQINIRGRNVEPLPIQKGMKHTEVYEYRPRQLQKDETVPSDYSGPLIVSVHIGFAKEAPDTNVAGFCVYHRNRLIKPYWKVYSSASSVGRGVIGYLQVDFVEPAHDKQDFENTPPLQKLEKYLKRQVPLFWRNKASFIGYQEGCAQNNFARPSMRVQKLGILPQGHHSPREDTQGEGPTGNGLEPVNAIGMARKRAPSFPSAEDTDAHHEVRISTNLTDINASVHFHRQKSFQLLGWNDLFNARPASSYLSKVSRRSKNVAASSKYSGLEFHLPQMRENWTWSGAEKAGPMCIQQMQGEVAKLQEGMQDLCNTHAIDEKVQGDLGKIFGTAITNIMNPVKVLSTTCGVQMEVLKAVLSYLSELGRSGSMDEPFPRPLSETMRGLGIPVVSPVPDDKTVTSDETHEACEPIKNQVSSPTSRAEEYPHSASEHWNGGLNKTLASEVHKILISKEAADDNEKNPDLNREAVGEAHPNITGNEYNQTGVSVHHPGGRSNPEILLQAKPNLSGDVYHKVEESSAALSGNLRAQETMRLLERRQMERGQRKPATIARPKTDQSTKSCQMEQYGRNVVQNFLHSNLKESGENVPSCPSTQTRSELAQFDSQPKHCQSLAVPEQAQTEQGRMASLGTHVPTEEYFQARAPACGNLENPVMDASLIVEEAPGDDGDMLVDQQYSQPKALQAEGSQGTKRPADTLSLSEQASPKRSKPNSDTGITEGDPRGLSTLDNSTYVHAVEVLAPREEQNGDPGKVGEAEHVGRATDADAADVSAAVLHRDRPVVDTRSPHPGG